MSELDELYPEVLAAHVRHPRRYGLHPHPTITVHERSSTCGDEVTLQLLLDGDRIVGAAWTGEGCMISRASASILADQLPGLSTADVALRIASFRTSIRSRGSIPVDEELLGDAAALGGASRVVARATCALLPWIAAESALRATASAVIHGDPLDAGGRESGG